MIQKTVTLAPPPVPGTMRSAAVRLLLAAKNSLLGVKALHMNLSPRGIAMVLEGPDEATIERAHVELQKHLDEERPHAG